MVQPSPRWTDILVHAGFLLMVPPLAMKFGQSMRQSDVRAESSLRDNRTLLYNETGFFVHGAMLLDDCNKRDRPFSMVLLNGRDLRDIPGLLGRKVTNDLFAQIVQGIGAVPGEGIAARTDSVEFALLLPGVTVQGAVALVRHQLGDPPKVEVHIAGKPVVIGLDMAVSQSVDKTQSLEGLYDALHLRWAERQSLKRRKGDQPDSPDKSGKADKTTPKLPGFDDDQATIVRHEASPTVPLPLSALQQKN
jgi:GGDEF domain-containing protein